MTKKRPPMPTITAADGSVVRLDSLPLVAYSLACGHMSRDYGVVEGDQMFCDICKDTEKVTRILAD